MSSTTVSLVAPDRRGWTAFETFFGVIFPIFCFALDLFVLKLSLMAPFALCGVSFLGILAFILARFKMPSSFGEVILGMLYASAAAAALIGIALVGVLGLIQVQTGGPLPSIFKAPLEFAVTCAFLSLALVPLFTAKAFYNRAAAVARRYDKRNIWLMALGALFLVGAPLAAQYKDYRWLEPHLAALGQEGSGTTLSSRQTEDRLQALRALNEYPFGFGRMKKYACWVEKHGIDIDGPTTRELEKLVGVEEGRSINLACSFP